MATATEIAEIVRKLRELEVGQRLRVTHAEMKDLFAQAVVAQGSSSPGHHGHTRLNFREAERHMPKDYGGKSAPSAEFSFKIELPWTPGGELLKRAGELDRANDCDLLTEWDTEFWHVRQLSAALASFPHHSHDGRGRNWRDGSAQSPSSRDRRRWPGSSSPPHVRRSPTCSVMEWELRVVEHEGRFNEQIPESVKVAALRRMLTSEMAERCMEGPNTYPELRARVRVHVGEKLVQSGQGTAPMDIGEQCDDTVDAVNARKKGSGRCSAQPRKQVKFDPPRAPTPNTGGKHPADGRPRRRIWFATLAVAKATLRDAALHPRRTPSTTKTSARRTRGMRRRLGGPSGQLR